MRSKIFYRSILAVSAAALFSPASLPTVWSQFNLTPLSDSRIYKQPDLATGELAFRLRSRRQNRAWGGAERSGAEPQEQTREAGDSPVAARLRGLPELFPTRSRGSARLRSTPGFIPLPASAGWLKSEQSAQNQSARSPNQQPAQDASKPSAQNTQSQPAQDQPVRIKTELIELRAVVTDKQGRAVTDLKQEDFELQENGKRQGLAPPAMFDASIGAMPQDPRVSGYISAGERDLENSLNALAKDTGGEAFFNSNDTLAAMGRALSDNEYYYALAYYYYPTSEESEKKFRKITIKIRNHPEYQVRAQRSYLPSELAKKSRENEALTPQQRFVNAMLAPLPRTEIGMTASADFIEYPQDATQVTISVYLDARTLTSREEGGRHLFDAEVVTMLFNSDGKRVDLKSDTLRGSLVPARWAIALQNGFNTTGGWRSSRGFISCASACAKQTAANATARRRRGWRFPI